MVLQGAGQAAGDLCVAILHHHLGPGGVTGSIAGHLEALSAVGAPTQGLRVALLRGKARRNEAEGRPVPAFEAPVREVAGLGYDAAGARPQPLELARRIEAALRELGFAPPRTVIHAHNHSLGKNLSLPGALAELARRGYALLLHIHDFAEDFRPANYRRLAAALDGFGGRPLPALLYPQASSIHYAVLNGRDRGILRRAGVQAGRLHLLPNILRAPARAGDREAARRRLARRGIPRRAPLLLYPGRAIRRKNVGEALLWAALAPPGTRLAFTLSPITPAERRPYERWKAAAARLGLPCLFELGEGGGLGLEESLAAADRVLTTSVAEGFGLTLLEACLASRPLIGRDLPEITADFVAAGVRFPGLAARLWLPLSWVGRGLFLSSFAASYQAALAAYGLAAPPARLLRAEIERLVEDGRVDFASLASALQERVLERALEPAGRERLWRLNPWIEEALAGEEVAAPSLLAANAHAVSRGYAPGARGDGLLALYREIVASPRASRLRPPPRGEAVLAELLAPRRFHPIRVEE